jgi:hypothetical protein
LLDISALDCGAGHYFVFLDALSLFLLRTAPFREKFSNICEAQ